MDHDVERLAQHLREVIDARLLDPLEILLESADAVAGTRGQIAERACDWAQDVLGTDERRAVAAISRLIAALYPGDGPFDPPAEWWRTPLGQAVVRRIGHPFAEAVSYPVAGAMLGITRQFVHNLAGRGKLERHPDGGVTVASVRARLAEHPAAQDVDAHTGERS